MQSRMYEEIIGFGLAGNFANHLEQAGEAGDFACIVGDEECAPKGIFPFYIPTSPNPLGRYCINNEEIVLPNDEKLCIQAEPEVALECEIIYTDNKIISALKPRYFMAFNDVSVRNDKNAKKLSQKKNFSRGSKAIGHKKIPINRFEEGGICDEYSIASFIKAAKGGEIEHYGEVVPLISYSYFYKKLIDWIVKKLNTQENVAILENLREVIKEANYPKKAIFAIGATRYMPKNEGRFLENGDRVVIAVFSHKKYSIEEVKKIADMDCIPSDLEDISIVNQRVTRD